MTPNLEEARKFYEGVLDLELGRVGETSVTYETGKCELKIQTDFDPGVLKTFNMSPPPESNRGAGAVHILEKEEEVDVVFNRMADQIDDTGGKFVTEPRDVPWGDRMFLIQSPDGYIFEIRGSGG